MGVGTGCRRTMSRPIWYKLGAANGGKIWGPGLLECEFCTGPSGGEGLSDAKELWPKLNLAPHRTAGLYTTEIQVQSVTNEFAIEGETGGKETLQ